MVMRYDPGDYVGMLIHERSQMMSAALAGRETNPSPRLYRCVEVRVEVRETVCVEISADEAEW